MSKFPYQLEILTEEGDAQIRKDFKGYLSGALKVLPEGYFFTGLYADYASKYYNFPVRSSDVFVASYPKCGTTWTQELVWLLVHDLNYKGAQQILDKRFPFIEVDMIVDYRLYELPAVVGKMKPPTPGPAEELGHALNAPDPRCLKTHLPFSLLPKELLDTCKVVYVARNPRDVLVSYYHHSRMFLAHDFKGNFHEFFHYFIHDQVVWSPFWTHLKEAWNRRHHENLLFITYDQLKADLPKVIRDVAAFLGKKVVNEEVTCLASHLSFATMKSNPWVNMEELIELGFMSPSEGGFIRKGTIDGSQSYFDNEKEEKFQEWLSANGQGLEKQFGWK